MRSGSTPLSNIEADMYLHVWERLKIRVRRKLQAGGKKMEGARIRLCDTGRGVRFQALGLGLRRAMSHAPKKPIEVTTLLAKFSLSMSSVHPADLS